MYESFSDNNSDTFEAAEDGLRSSRASMHGREDQAECDEGDEHFTEHTDQDGTPALIHQIS